MPDKPISEAELMVDKIYNLMEDEWNPLDGSHKAGLISDSNMDMAIKIAELLKAGQAQALDWVDEVIKKPVLKKFPRGERKWCIDCARRIAKYQRQLIKQKDL